MATTDLWQYFGPTQAKQTVGGACRTEYPFAKAPNLGISTGAYLLGLFPPELLQVPYAVLMVSCTVAFLWRAAAESADCSQALELQLPLIRRDPHYFLPTTDHRYLMFGSDVGATERQFKKFFSAQDWYASLLSPFPGSGMAFMYAHELMSSAYLLSYTATGMANIGHSQTG